LHNRIVAGVSMVLFALLAVAVTLLAGMHDRSYPQQLGVKSLAILDFNDATVAEDEAITQLGELSDRLGIGLVKLAPDLGGDQSGQVFVRVGTEGDLPDVVRRFGGTEDAEVRDSGALANSFANGQYLVTGSTDRLPELKDWLTTRGVGQEWTDNTLTTTLGLLVAQSSFAIALLAGTALMISLVLYWLSVKARGRALRSLGGVSTWRIQCEDLSGFLVAMGAAAGVVGGMAVLYVGFGEGWSFVPFYVSRLVLFDAVVIGVTMAGAVAMSMVSWPSPAMIANRVPAVLSLRKASIALKGITFTLVLATVAPAFSAYTAATGVAEDQSRWTSLADQVTLSFVGGLGESGFQEVMGSVGEVVRDAEQRGAVALSYTWDDQTLNDVDMGSYDAVSLVSQGWLDLMGDEGDRGRSPGVPPAGSTSIEPDELTPGLKQFLDDQLRLLLRDKSVDVDVFGTFELYAQAGPGRMPLAKGSNGRELLFPDAALVIVAPSVYEVFDDGFIVSAGSTSNIIFTGLGATQHLLHEHEVPSKVQVKYVAEEGILIAQYLAFFAWLQGVSLVALVVSLIVSSLIAAFISATLRAKRDFPLRLAGHRWSDIVAERVGAEWLIGGALAVMVIMLRGSRGAALVAGIALVALVASPLAHLLATRWVFGNVSRRRL
jgi:hypothetical protein